MAPFAWGIGLMRFRLAVAIVATFGLTVAWCSNARAAGKLSKIFNPEMLGVEVAYLESLIGPAMRVSEGRGGVKYRSYKVDGCQIEAFVEGSEARRYALSLTPKCNFNLGAFLSGYSSTKGFAKFLKNERKPVMRFYADCISSFCGNAADPVVDFVWEGPHSDNFMSIRLRVVLAGGPALDAGLRLDDVMRREGDQYMLDTKFNCDGKYDEAAVREFANVAVNEIVIGFDKNNDRCARQ